MAARSEGTLWPVTWEVDEAEVQVCRTIRELRRARGWTQRALAARLGATQPYVAKLEAGGQSPTLRQLAKVAGALRCRVTLSFTPAEPAAGGTVGPSWQDILRGGGG